MEPSYLRSTPENKEGYVAPIMNLPNFTGGRSYPTPLRPAGSAEIKGMRVDVVSEGNFIPPETKIQVVK